jgi:hypothetical protein
MTRASSSALLILTLCSVSKIVIPTASFAQAIVHPDAKRFTQSDCQWLYRQLLDDCIAVSTTCPSNRYEWGDDFSMSTVRGMHSLETVLTVRVMEAIEYACKKACQTKKKPEYQQRRNSI